MLTNFQLLNLNLSFYYAYVVLDVDLAEINYLLERISIAALVVSYQIRLGR